MVRNRTSGGRFESASSWVDDRAASSWSIGSGVDWPRICPSEPAKEIFDGAEHYLPFLYDDAAAKVREANNAYLGDNIATYRLGS